MTSAPAPAFDVVDSQVHLNHLGPLDAGIAAMNAVGVASVMFDEYDRTDEHGRFLPGEELADDVFRPLSPLAEAAATRFRECFGVLRRVAARDPQLATIARALADAPYAAALRMTLFDPAEVDALARGELDPPFRAAADCALPLVVLTPGRPDLLAHYAERYSRVTILIDHCGVPFERGASAAALERVRAMARHANIMLKWSAAPFFVSGESYPFADAIAALRRMLSAYGAERIMWGSDFTMSQSIATWAESLFHIRDNPVLSDEEKAWILGRTARAVFGLPGTDRG